MAKLKSGHLTLEITYQEIDKEEWVQYEIRFLWQNEPIVNDALLKRQTEYWRKRKIGAFKANQYREDDLIATIEKVLISNEADYWEPLEPDVTIGIYPGRYFPFVHVNTLQEQKIEIDSDSKDDVITIIVAVDMYNFQGSEAYYGESIALIMIPTRQALETFISELKQEYLQLKSLQQN